MIFFNDVQRKRKEKKMRLILFYPQKAFAQSAGAIEYTDCFSAEG